MTREMLSGPWLYVAALLHAGPLWALGIERPQEERAWLTVVMPPSPPKFGPLEVSEEKAATPKPLPRKRRKARRSSGRPSRPSPRPERQASPSSPEAPKAKPSKAPEPRRLVGLSMGSTVEGGTGGAFSTGHTLDGRTSEQARFRPARGPPLGNRRARAVPQGPNVQRPRRLRAIEPEYPDELRSLGLEDEVVVQVKLTATGEVDDVRILRHASRPAFDRAALRAARAERFSPALKDGRAIEYILSFTYRFRIRG